MLIEAKGTSWEGAAMEDGRVWVKVSQTKSREQLMEVYHNCWSICCWDQKEVFPVLSSKLDTGLAPKEYHKHYNIWWLQTCASRRFIDLCTISI